MAQDRTNMVSLLDIGTLMSGLTPKIVELGNGFSEITEDWGPDTSDTQYVNMKSKSSTVKGYGLSMTPEREFISDEVQTAINKIFKLFPTGADCETYYYRFYKTDLSESGESMTGDCIKVPVTVCASSTGGQGGDPLTSSIQINGNGDVEVGTVTISAAGEYSWATK